MLRLLPLLSSLKKRKGAQCCTDGAGVFSAGAAEIQVTGSARQTPGDAGDRLLYKLF